MTGPGVLKLMLRFLPTQQRRYEHFHPNGTIAGLDINRIYLPMSGSPYNFHYRDKVFVPKSLWVPALSIL